MDAQYLIGDGDALGEGGRRCFRRYGFLHSFSPSSSALPSWSGLIHYAPPLTQTYYWRLGGLIAGAGLLVTLFDR